VAVGAMAISSEEKKKNKSNEGIALFVKYFNNQDFIFKR